MPSLNLVPVPPPPPSPLSQIAASDTPIVGAPLSPPVQAPRALPPPILVSPSPPALTFAPRTTVAPSRFAATAPIYQCEEEEGVKVVQETKKDMKEEYMMKGDNIASPPSSALLI